MVISQTRISVPPPPPLLSYLKLNYEKNRKKPYDILKPESLRDNVLYCLIYFMFFDNLTTEYKKFWFPCMSHTKLVDIV